MDVSLAEIIKTWVAIHPKLSAHLYVGLYTNAFQPEGAVYYSPPKTGAIYYDPAPNPNWSELKLDRYLRDTNIEKIGSIHDNYVVVFGPNDHQTYLVDPLYASDPNFFDELERQLVRRSNVVT